MSGPPIALNLLLNPGDKLPNYDTPREELAIEGVVITEQATIGRLPVLQLKLRAPDGKLFLAALTGRQVCALAGAVRGINERNHGTPEP